MKAEKVKEELEVCEWCEDTGYYGDNGPGIEGNDEYHECDQCDIGREKRNKLKNKKWDVNKYHPHQRMDILRRNENIDNGRELCEKCNGTGNQLFSMYQKCSDCDGKGYVKPTAQEDLPVMTEREIFEENIKCKVVSTPCENCASLKEKLAAREDEEKGRCCCGRIQDFTDPVTFNDTRHERLGPDGNFCGPLYKHELRDLRITLTKKDSDLQLEVKAVNKARRELGEIKKAGIEACHNYARETLQLQGIIVEKNNLIKKIDELEAEITAWDSTFGGMQKDYYKAEAKLKEKDKQFTDLEKEMKAHAFCEGADKMGYEAKLAEKEKRITREVNQNHELSLEIIKQDKQIEELKGGR